MARLHLIMLLTLKGTPFLYNGEEIGMSDLIIEDAGKFRDPLSLLYAELERKVMGSDERTAIQKGAFMGRDRNRTPMQWSDAPNAGFCPAGVEPWLPVNPDYNTGVNVDTQERLPDSLLHFYQQMLKLRKDHPSLQTGEFQEIDTDNDNVLVYRRWNAQEELVVVLNLSDSIQKVELPAPAGIVLFSNLSLAGLECSKTMELTAYQGMICL